MFNFFRFYFTLLFVFATGVSSPARTAKQSAQAAGQTHPAILEAQKKFLNRDRRGAVTILQDAIKIEKTRARLEELTGALHQLATMFISEEGQRAFELANAIRFSGQNNYMAKYSEALVADEDNWSIYLYQALGYLQQKKCKQAKEVVDKAEMIDALRAENDYLKIKIQLCNKEEVLRSSVVALDFLDDKKIYKDIVFAQVEALAQKQEESLRYAARAISADKNFPMGYYWSWVALKESESPGLEFAQKYRSLCRSMTTALRQKYYLEPELCFDLERVEGFIKKAEAAP